MATVHAERLTMRGRPGWGFALLWVVASFLGAMLYFLPVGAVYLLMGLFVGDLERLADPQRAGEIGIGLRLLAVILVGGACGSTIGLAQGLVLRRYLPVLGHWVVATMAGYAALGLAILVGAAAQSGWLDWAIVLVVNGKLHWLARVLVEWPSSSWAPGALALTLLGGGLGVAQWFALRGHLRGAGWLVAINAGGWALLAALYLPVFGIFAVKYGFVIPYALNAAGLVWLLRRPEPAGRTLRAIALFLLALAALEIALEAVVAIGQLVARYVFGSP